MPVRVILLNDQRHLGKRGQVIEVKPGYARNYLLPQGLALEATHANTKYFEQQRTKIDARHAQEKSAAEAIAAQLGALTVTIPKRVGETQTLYGSVTAGDIADALEKKGFTLDRRRIDLTGGIKTLGDHPVRIDLHPEVLAEVIVAVTREE
jgi:large subunit ribosomal protein L9